MGQYRFSIELKRQIGINIKINEYSLDISLPFTTIYIAITKHANGINIFGKYF